jgi:hypothetical protein
MRGGWVYKCDGFIYLNLDICTPEKVFFPINKQ